jgi:hypothetical protein
LGTPFSAEAASYARRLAVRSDRWPDTRRALNELLARWQAGMVTDRRERRIAVRMGAERAALPAAAELGTTLTHIRFALEYVDPEPPRGPRKAPPVGWQLRERARAVLTAAFFQREYLDGEKTLRHIAEETGIRREIVAEIAKEHGITLIRTRRPFPIDEAWLREQYLTHKRSATDIANELGTEDMTVLRRLHHLGVPVRPTGVHSQTPMVLTLGSHIPRDIRKAVEGSLHGWHRLARFQTAIAFPTLAEAARHIGADPSALTEQFKRLERDIGAQLYHRATPVRGGGHRPHRPTRRGAALLRALRRADIQPLVQGRDNPVRPLPSGR